MAGIAAPNIVKDGLVFAVDPANQRSYPGSGTTATDLVGTNNGTLSNTGMFATNNLGVFSYDFVSDYIELEDAMASLLSGGIISINSWIKIPSVGSHNHGAIINFKHTTDDKHGILTHFYLGTFTPNFRLTQTDGTLKNITGDDISADIWHNMVYIADGSNLKLYIDTNIDSSSPSYDGTIYAPTAARIGQQYGYRSLYGEIGPIQIYNRALSASEVRQNYNALKGRFQ